MLLKFDSPRCRNQTCYLSSLCQQTRQKDRSRCDQRPHRPQWERVMVRAGATKGRIDTDSLRTTTNQQQHAAATGGGVRESRIPRTAHNKDIKQTQRTNKSAQRTPSGMRKMTCTTRLPERLHHRLWVSFIIISSTWKEQMWSARSCQRHLRPDRRST